MGCEGCSGPTSCRAAYFHDNSIALVGSSVAVVWSFGYRRMATLAETSSQHKSRRFKTAGRCLLRTLTVQNVPPEKSVDRYGRMLATDETNTSGPKSRRSQRSGPCDLRVSAISGESEKSAVQRSPVPRLQAPSRISATGAVTNVPAEFAMTLKQGLFSMSRTGRTFNRR